VAWSFDVGWDWSQNDLGDDSDMVRQLAISSVPTCYLIGPDGLLVASSSNWLEIKGKLTTALEGAQDSSAVSESEDK